MPLREVFAVALQALRRNKLRSFLTLLGVIIGVATVVSVVSIISGLNSYVMDKVLNLNPDVLVFTKYGIIRSRQGVLPEIRVLVQGDCAAANVVGQGVGAGIEPGADGVVG